ncbi:MAG: tetratricopeptide (TPR) repeat protein [Planctomycetota bacterium]|jgi:tetratricopeptide (TPR) repeat protein
MNNSDEILSSLIVAEVFGNALVVEPRGDELFCSLAASVQSVVVCRAEESGEEDCDELRSLGCEVVAVTPKSLSDIEHQASLLIFDIPEGENPEEFLDLALSKTADDGFVLIDIQVESKSQLGRLQRILEASLSEVIEDQGWSEGGRLSLAGRRNATGNELTIGVSDEPLDVTVLCYVDDESEALDELAVSLLFRQSVFPSLVVFLDDSKDENVAIPDDLWGMASQSPTQPVLIRTGGVGRTAAYREGARHVETKYSILIESGQMPSPRWAEQLSLALDLEEGADFAFSAALEYTPEGEGPENRAIQLPDRGSHNPYVLLLMALGHFPLSGAVMFKRELLQQLLADETLCGDDGLIDDLIVRASEKAEVVNVLMPLLSAIRAPRNEAVSRSMMTALHERGTLDRLIDSLKMMPPEEQHGMALEIRAEAMLEVGAFDQAIADYESALVLDPDYPELRVEYLVALRSAGRADQVVTQVRHWLDDKEAEADIRYSLLLAWGLFSQGALESARELLLELERENPSDLRVLLDLQVLEEDPARSSRGRRLIDLLQSELPDATIEALCL